MARGGFPGGMGNMQNLMKQAQQMQRQMQQMQEELEVKEFEGTAGGVVTAVVNGKKQLLNINIKPEAVDPDDVEMLEDLVLTAVNAAMKAAEEETESKMGRLTGGMNIPGMF
ncbi:YbaB/EbfC family nucleoid-associated protein [Clostridium mediterraneense]|uniref:YbaB/EbfC family nucleoid-associated protein n=1 Tax=Clostridium mediterraneense TaxID=1805472 RepID=UPI0008372BAF|nr:YbaB/EbfC family nucleoid-associated protein [Clostridium mediterraneense]